MFDVLYTPLCAYFVSPFEKFSVSREPTVTEEKTNVYIYIVKARKNLMSERRRSRRVTKKNADDKFPN